MEFDRFVELLRRAFSQRDLDCYIDVLTSEDLESLKQRKTGGFPTKKSSTNNALTKRYIILTYMANDTKYHYPLSLTPNKL